MREILVNPRPDAVISGYALGIDQMVVEEASKLSIPIVAAIPFKGQESAWSQFSQARYHELLAKASRIVYVCEPGYAKEKMQRRNEWMVDNSNVLVAFWNGTDGGTANCVRYARKQNKPVVVVPVDKL